MTRCIATAAVVLLVYASAGDAFAQRRGGGNPQSGAAQGHRSPSGETPASAGAPAQPVAPGSRFTSTLKFVPPPPDRSRAPLPSAAFIGPGTFNGIAFWPWGAWLPVPVYTGPAMLEPPLKDAPVGGVQLDIDPRRAQVYVDGAYAGLVEEFSGYFRHLDIPAGPHTIAIVASDYEPLILQVNVTPGATTTHRATLARAYGR